jgi:hypothetical protein
MAIGKIEGIPPVSTINPKVTHKPPEPLPAKPDIKPPGKTEDVVETKNVTKVKDAPFFPIGDTWSIFNKLIII